MEITGKLIQILPAQTGTGKNGPWKKCDFIIETADKFPKTICITAWKELVDQIEKTATGTQLNISFDLSSREYNGKWYTDVKAWKIIEANGNNVSSIMNHGLDPNKRIYISGEEAKDLIREIKEENLDDGVPF